MVLPCLMSAFNSIGGSCFGWVGERIKTEAAHLFYYNANIENLRTQVQNLSDAIESVDVRVEEAESRGATRVDPVVVTLLKNMASLKEEAYKLTRDEEREADSRCLMGLRTNLWAYYQASKSAKKAIDEAVELLEEKNKFDGPVANVDRSKCLGVTPNPDFEKFESRVLVSNQIVEALNDPSVNMVGVYGMGGTGKTTLAEKIGAELQLNGTFSYVVLVTVSEKQSQLQNNYQSDLTSIQKQIAGGLKIQLQGENLRDRAAELREQLQKRDKVLIILDDIWSRFELKDVGIPIGSSVHTKFIILMTSRDKIVLENQMDSRKTFGLDSLPFDDARNLFDKMVGGASEYSSWRPTAEQVVEECGGIPILLATIGRALRNANRSIWEDALTQLKQFHGKNFDEEAYKRIEVSYKFLKSEETKKLFLLCAQLNHRSILEDDLLRYAIGLDLFEECKKLKEVSNRLQKYLRDLKGCCLLQDGNEEGIIKMHDVVHKFATFVASRDHHMFTGDLEEWPSKDQFEKFTAISFFNCRLPSDHMLPEAFDNPNLESFLMFRSEIDASFKIPDNFFAGMKGLKLMYLTKMSLSPALVSSLSALGKIRTLCLDGCELGDIAVIGELPKLQALSLTGSSIVCIPEEIGKLGSTLKLLDLRHCSKLKSIASGVISKLTLLEDLRIGDSFKDWEPLEGSDKSNNSADETYEAKVTSLEEFKNLRNLINLEIHIREHAKMFPKDLVFKNLETFKIFFRKYHHDGRDYVLPRTLDVVEFSTVVEFGSEGTKALMTRAESLHLGGVTSSVSVSEMDPNGFPELKHLNVNDGGIQYIVKKNYTNNCIFPKLETFHLKLPKLERICDDHDHPPQVGSFENLTVIHVRFCDVLNDLFSSNLARGLLRLKEIRVWYCESMESIIVSRESENEEEITIGFTHQLRVLDLCKLPRLLSFYSFKQLEGLPSPTHLFNKKILFPKLEVLNLSLMKIEKIWDDHFAIAAEGTCSFQNLTSLTVIYCENLSYLFPFSMVKSFAQLKHLEIGYCESIEEIVVTMKGEMEGERLLLFPKLENLVLRDLPKLNFFGHANLFECQSLQELRIVRCPLLKAFIGTNDSTPDLGANSTTLFDEKIVFPKLESLWLTEIKVEKIWDDETAISAGRSCWLQNLTSLHVYACGNLSYLFSSSMVKSLAKLEELEVDNCASIKEIVASTERETAGKIQLSFPKLDRLKLENLPNLKRFCHANLLECQLLRELLIKKCLELKTFISTNDSSPDNSATLFSEKVAFPNMERLEISGCGSLEKVFDVQILPMNERVRCRILPFQNLRSVSVSDCPTLTSIFPTSLLPTLLQQLERLEVENCDKIDLFGLNNSQQLNDAFAKVISGLKYCHLERGGMKVKYKHRRSSWKLTIDLLSLKVSPILFALLKSFPKLDKVKVSSSSIIQLFPCEPDHLAAADGDDMDTQAKTLARIRHLKLTKLPNMKHIWSEHSPLKYHEIPGDPEVLEVFECDSLLSLAPPSTTLFKNLTGLVVWKCPMLIKLVAFSSTAKSLVNLKEMRVFGCDFLEEIVVIDDQSDDKYIVFDKLEVLVLRYLNSLTSFCSTSDCNFQFPLLNRVIVYNCPKMKFFSAGTLSTPKLIMVQNGWYNEDETRARWEGNLNSTIGQLFKENQARREVKEEEEEEEEDGDGDGGREEDEDENDDGDEHEDENENGEA